MDAMTIIGIVTATLTVCTLIGGVVVMAARWVRRVGHFLDDWQGQDARPGQVRRPGILERLTAVEGTVAQLRPNGGSSVADSVNRIEQILHDRTSQINRIDQATTDPHPTPPAMPAVR